MDKKYLPRRIYNPISIPPGAMRASLDCVFSISPISETPTQDPGLMGTNLALVDHTIPREVAVATPDAD